MLFLKDPGVSILQTTPIQNSPDASIAVSNSSGLDRLSGPEMDIDIEAVASLEEYVGTYLEMKLKINRVKSTNASVFCDGEDNKRKRMWCIYITTNSGKTLPSWITATFKKKVKTTPRQGFLKLL